MSRAPSRPPRIRPRKARPSLESLEARQLLATFTVVNTLDSGAGSLRAAITSANADTSTGVDSIDFDIPGSGFQHIDMLSGLPAITRPTLVDGKTQPGFAVVPLVVLDGSNAGTTAGLTIKGNGSTVQGLAVERFSGDGIDLDSLGEAIAGDWIGVDPSNTSPAGNAGVGVFLSNTDFGPLGRLIVDNVVSGNTAGGIDDSGIGDLLIQGNRVGTDPTGMFALGNGGDGIEFNGLTFGTRTIGGNSPGEGNLISANSGDGIFHDTSQVTTDSVVIEGNHIGTDVSGRPTLPNDGFDIDRTINTDESNGSFMIGGTAAGEANVLNILDDRVYFAGVGFGFQSPDDQTVLNDLGVGNTLLSPTFLVTNTLDSGPGSLRAAILAADTDSSIGVDTIDFAISGAGVQHIMTTSALPAITRPTFIDGTTQFGYAGSPLVVLDGLFAGPTDGLAIMGADSTVRGLAVILFRGDGIDVAATFVTIAGNSIGVDPSNTLVAGNLNAGIATGAAGTYIVGNVISGNHSGGINDGDHGGLIEANIIGLDASETHPLDNGGIGIGLAGATNVRVDRNLLNDANGMALASPAASVSSNNEVVDNTLVLTPSTVLAVTSENTTPGGTTRVGTPDSVAFKVSNLGSYSANGLSVILDLAELDLAPLLGPPQGVASPYPLTPMAGWPGFYVATIGTLAPGATATIPIVFLPTRTAPIFLAAGIVPNSQVVANPAQNQSILSLNIVPAAQIIQAVPLVSDGKDYAVKVSFDVPLNKADAENVRNYHLSMTVDGGRGDKKVETIAIPIESVEYNATKHLVVIRISPRNLPKASQTLTLVVGGPGSVGLVNSSPILDEDTMVIGPAVKSS